MSAIESVRDLHRSKLVERHEELFAEPPPRGISQPLLARIVAYETQAITHGGLPLRTRKRLQSVTQDASIPASATRLKKDGSFATGTACRTLSMLSLAVSPTGTKAIGPSQRLRARSPEPGGQAPASLACRTNRNAALIQRETDNPLRDLYAQIER